jgi:Meckel syndrome type 1 protein
MLTVPKTPAQIEKTTAPLNVKRPSGSGRASPPMSNRRLPHEVSRTAVMAYQPTSAPSTIPPSSSRSSPPPSISPSPAAATFGPQAPASMGEFAVGMGPFWTRRTPPPAPPSYVDGFASAASTGTVLAPRSSKSWLVLTAVASAVGGLAAFVVAMYMNEPSEPPATAQRTSPTMLTAGARRAPSTAPAIVVEAPSEAPKPATPAAAPPSIATPPPATHAAAAPSVVTPPAAATSPEPEPPRASSSSRGAKGARSRAPAPKDPASPPPAPASKGSARKASVAAAPPAAPGPAPADPADDAVAGAEATHAQGKGVIDSAL